MRASVILIIVEQKIHCVAMVSRSGVKANHDHAILDGRVATAFRLHSTIRFSIDNNVNILTSY